MLQVDWVLGFLQAEAVAMVSKIAAASSEEGKKSAAEEADPEAVLDENKADTLVHMVKAMGPVINQQEEKHLEQVGLSCILYVAHSN